MWTGGDCANRVCACDMLGRKKRRGRGERAFVAVRESSIVDEVEGDCGCESE